MDKAWKVVVYPLVCAGAMYSIVDYTADLVSVGALMVVIKIVETLEE